MAGGLMNLVSAGQQNVILNGNPKKTFFKAAYARYTNFGLQKFRVDFDGSRTLRLAEPSHFTFKIPRYADLLMDTYLVVTLPMIWSPIIKSNGTYKAYEFKWIKNIGTQIFHVRQKVCICLRLKNVKKDAAIHLALEGSTAQAGIWEWVIDVCY